MDQSKNPTNRTKNIIKLAAKLRVQGCCWAKVAPRINRKTANTASQLPHEYPALWDEAYEDARRSYLNSMEAEAILTQKELMQPTYKIQLGEEEESNELPTPLDIRQRAAHSILNHSRHSRGDKLHLTGELDHKVRTTTDLIEGFTKSVRKDDPDT